MVKRIYNEEAWLNIIELLTLNDSVLFGEFDPIKYRYLYAIVLDSACSFFTEDELMQIEKLSNERNLMIDGQRVSIIKEALDSANFDVEAFANNVLSDLDTNDIIVKKLIDFSVKSAEIGLYWEIDLSIYEDGFIPNQGIRYFYLYDYEKSYEYFYDKIVNHSDTTYINLLFYGRNLYVLERIDEAIKIFKKAKRYSKFRSEADYYLADIFFYDKFDTDSAYIAILDALSKDPDDYENKLLSARIYWNIKEIDKAIQICSDLIFDFPNEKTRTYRLRGKLYADKEDLDKAENDYRTILRIDSLNIEGLLGVGEVFFFKNQLDSAMYYANKSYQIDKTYFLTNALKGDVYMMKDEYLKAEEHFTCALEYGENSIFLNNLGFCKMQQEKYEESIEIFHKVISEYNPDKLNETAVAFTLNNLGFCYYKLGQLDEAMENVLKSIELLPSNACATINKALILIEEGKWKESCEEFEKAKELMFLDFCGIDYEELVRTNCNKRE